MATITFNGNEYFSYASIEEADTYIGPTEYGAVWNILTSDQKAGYLIQATRFLDSLPWKEECGSTQELRLLNPNIVQACMEIAARLANGETDIINGGTAEGGVQTLKAGSAQISYFQRRSWKFGIGAVGALITGLPSAVASLIIDCIDAPNPTGVGRAKSFGTCYPSTLNKSWDLS